MKQLRNFGDERQVAQCAYCGRTTQTRDHVPSRVLLDEPYPDNLPVVPACLECNLGFSGNEEYVACLIDCSIAGSASPDKVGRPKVQRILSDKPALAARIASASRDIRDDTHFSVESNRVESLILKLGRGHALFELNEPQYDEPAHLGFMPMQLMSEDARLKFEHPPKATIWPEIGSRAMQRLDMLHNSSSEWIVVQPGRYRYMAFVKDAVVVRIVLSEYLACEVKWG